MRLVLSGCTSLTSWALKTGLDVHFSHCDKFVIIMSSVTIGGLQLEVHKSTSWRVVLSCILFSQTSFPLVNCTDKQRDEMVSRDRHPESPGRVAMGHPSLAFYAISDS